MPVWTLPALVVLTVLAALLYGWGIAGTQLHLYFGPAVKSMSESWRAFVFGTFDPGAWVTLDKLPGAFWVQALSVRIFGFHAWSVLLPPVAESLLSILLLYRVVRRWLGPGAALIAAAMFATTPIVAAMARTQINDVLLVPLAVLAVEPWQRAVSRARLTPLLVCGLLVGLAFYTKMAEAWALWAPFGIAYLLAAPTTLSRRVWQLALAGGVTLVLSLAWVGFMLATPASARPWIDGSMDNSPISMVFGYNALNRFGLSGTGADALGIGALGAGPARRSEAPLTFMISNPVASQVGWLYPLVIAGLAGVFLGRKRSPEREADAPPAPLRFVQAGYLMWGLWLVAYATAFSLAKAPNTFYLVALAPPAAALGAGGLAILWSAYRSAGWRQWLLPATIVVTAAWDAYLSSRFPGFLPWLWPTLLAAGIAAAAVLAGAKLVRGRAPARLRTAGGGLVLVALLLAPSAWAASTVGARDVSHALRPSAGPAARDTAMLLGGRYKRLLPQTDVDRITAYVKARDEGQKYLLAVQWEPQAGPFILAGVNVLPVGGFTAEVPDVTPAQLRDLVARGDLRFALVDAPGTPGLGRDYRGYVNWVRQNCAPIDGFKRTLYDCRKTP